MHKSTITVVFLLFASALFAQTKVFKEVGEDISTQIKAISQDNALVGYLAFTRLERANEDSFNYRLTIMDENLNDIGSVNFRQGLLDLQSVSFEHDVLCLGYIQSPIYGARSVRNRRDLRRAQDAAASSHVLLQFINLNGKILNTYDREVILSTATYNPRSPFSGMRLMGYLRYGMQIRNIPDGGFIVFYGDSSKQSLLTFDIRGGLTHEQILPMTADNYYLHASATEIYLLTRESSRAPLGGFKLYVYNSGNLEAENNFDLRDADGNWLKVLSFDNDPATGDPYIAGCIVNSRRLMHPTADDIIYRQYMGLFTLDLGNAHKEMHVNSSYWSTGRMRGVSEDGHFNDREFDVRYATAFRDYKGNTYFAGTGMVEKGYSLNGKFKLTDGVFIRQDPSGVLTVDNAIPCEESKYFGIIDLTSELDHRNYYAVADPDTKTSYVIVDDDQNIYIYNVSTKRVMRTIPHKDGNIKINVFPAKEGHMLVAEYNRKEKSTRFSIEAL